MSDSAVLRIGDLTGCRVVVWGGGVEGLAAVDVLVRHGAPAELVVVQDGVPATAQLGGAPFLAVDDARSRGVLDAAEVIVKSPGVSPYHGAFAEITGGRRDLIVTGGTQLWFAEAAATGALTRTIAVTGSKGKSTTSSMVAHLLTAAGVETVLAGNVGRAPIDLLGEDLDTGTRPGWTVLEISSFQATEVRHSAAFGVLTALFPEHLDWHGDVERYYRDKCSLFTHPVGSTSVAANTANPDVRAMGTALVDAGVTLLAFGGDDGAYVVDDDAGVVRRADGAAVVTLADLRITGSHNAVNLCGALTILEAAGFDACALGPAAARFAPLDHRLQVIGRLPTGTLVVDDGLSTAPEAAVAALHAYDRDGVTILIGGHDRDLDYAALASALARRRRQTVVVTMPASGPRIAQRIAAACGEAANDSVSLVTADGLDDAVGIALRSTPPGGVILLSPAAPSFGRFANYRERSARFRELVGPLDGVDAPGT